MLAAVEVNSPLDNGEPNTASSLIDRVKKRFGIKPRTVGADKGYDRGPLLRGLERRKVRPHVAVKEGEIGGKSEWTCRKKQGQYCSPKTDAAAHEGQGSRDQPAVPQEDRGVDRVGQDDRRRVPHAAGRPRQDRPASARRRAAFNPIRMPNLAAG